LREEGFPKPNVSRLKDDMSKSRFTVKGNQKGTFQIDVRRLSDLEKNYGGLFKSKSVAVSGRIIPLDWVSGTRRYLEDLVHQINGTYEYGFYDARSTYTRRGTMRFSRGVCLYR